MGIKVQLADIDDKSHTPVLSYCRKLVKEGVDPDTVVQVYSGDTIALTVKNIGIGAQLTVNDDKYGRPVFRQWRPFRMPQKSM